MSLTNLTGFSIISISIVLKYCLNLTTGASTIYTNNAVMGLKVLSGQERNLSDWNRSDSLLRYWPNPSGKGQCGCSYHFYRELDSIKNSACSGSKPPCKSIPEPVQFQVFNGGYCIRQCYSSLDPNQGTPDFYINLWYRSQLYKGKTKNKQDCYYTQIGKTKVSSSCYPDFNDGRKFKAEYCKDPGRYDALDLYVYDEDTVFDSDDYVGTGQIYIQDFYSRLGQKTQYYIYGNCVFTDNRDILMDVDVMMTSEVNMPCDDDGFVKNSESSVSFDCLSRKDDKKGVCLVSKRIPCCSGVCMESTKTSKQCTCALGKPGSRCKIYYDCAPCPARKDSNGKEVKQRPSCRRKINGAQNPYFCICVDA